MERSGQLEADGRGVEATSVTHHQTHGPDTAVAAQDVNGATVRVGQEAMAVVDRDAPVNHDAEHYGPVRSNSGARRPSYDAEKKEYTRVGD